VRIGAITGPWAALELVTPRLPATVAKRFNALGDAVAATVAQSLPRADAGVSAAIADALKPLTSANLHLAIDSLLPKAAGLGTGDLALLRIEHSAGTSLLSLIAAVQDDEPLVLDDEAAPYFSDEALPASVVGQVEQRRANGDTVRVPPLTIPLAS
jgi:hypothetical protein